MKFNNKKFSNSFIQAKIDAGLPSLRSLGKELGISASTLSRIERGATPDILTFGILCKWMGVKMKKFFHYPPK